VEEEKHVPSVSLKYGLVALHVQYGCAFKSWMRRRRRSNISDFLKIFDTSRDFYVQKRFARVSRQNSIL
jgi:hypothetical protein